MANEFDILLNVAEKSEKINKFKKILFHQKSVDNGK